MTLSPGMVLLPAFPGYRRDGSSVSSSKVSGVVLLSAFVPIVVKGTVPLTPVTKFPEECKTYNIAEIIQFAEEALE